MQEGVKEAEHFITPNGLHVDFYSEGHIYKVEGIEVPSITTLLKTFYGDTYASANPKILKQAADYGTAVHDELQYFIEKRLADANFEINPIYPETQNYFTFVEDIYHIKPIATEKVVVLLTPEGNYAAAGRFDLLCTINDKLTLADFKTTSTIHKMLVTAQLNLYLTAAKQSGYIPNTDLNLGVIHLSKGKCRFVPIMKLKEDFYLQFII